MGNSSSPPPLNTSAAPISAKIHYNIIFVDINDPAELSPLIDYIGEFLSHLKTEHPEQGTKKDSKVHDVVKNNIEGASKLMEGISVAADELLGKDNFPPKLLLLHQQMSNVVSGVLNEMGKLHWIAVGFSLIALVLDTIEQVSSVSKKCVHLLEIMYNLTLHELMPDEEDRLNRNTCEIVEEIISCLCCMKQGTFFKYLFASIDEATLENVETA